MPTIPARARHHVEGQREEQSATDARCQLLGAFGKGLAVTQLDR